MPKKLVRLEPYKLLKKIQSKASNGLNIVDSYLDIKLGKGQYEIIDDSVSASIYGADITKMFKLSSPLGDLEKELKQIMESNDDRITSYVIEYKNNRYKIVSVRKKYIEILKL